MEQSDIVEKAQDSLKKLASTGIGMSLTAWDEVSNNLLECTTEITRLRADLAEAQAKIARLTEALAIAGPIALKVFDYHLFTLDAEDQRKVETIRAALQENANE